MVNNSNINSNPSLSLKILTSAHLELTTVIVKQHVVTQLDRSSVVVIRVIQGMVSYVKVRKLNCKKTMHVFKYLNTYLLGNDCSS